MSDEDAPGNSTPEWSFDFHADSFSDEPFSYRVAYSLAHASRLVYDDAVEEVQKQIGARAVKLAELDGMPNPFSFGPTQGFVIETETRLLLIFRGTSARDDWRVNLRVRPRHIWFSVPGRIHSGFWRALKLVWTPVVKPLVGSARESGKKIVIAGHSLGGALASLAAARIAKHGDRDLVASVYTFGQPRVGDARFVDYMNTVYGDSFARFVNRNDIVPMIPPRPLYRHIGKLYRFDANGELKEAEAGNDRTLSPEEFEKFVEFTRQNSPAEAARKGIEFRASQRGNVQDHSMDTGYIPALEKLLD